MIFLGINLDGIITLILLIIFVPAIILAGIGFLILRIGEKARKQANLREKILDDDLLSPNKDKNKKKVAKVFFILAGVYLVISLGILGPLIL